MATALATRSYRLFTACGKGCSHVPLAMAQQDVKQRYLQPPSPRSHNSPASLAGNWLTAARSGQR